MTKEMQESKQKRQAEKEKYQALRPAEKLIYNSTLASSVDRLEQTSREKKKRGQHLHLPSINQTLYNNSSVIV